MVLWFWCATSKDLSPQWNLSSTELFWEKKKKKNLVCTQQFTPNVVTDAILCCLEAAVHSVL